MLVKNLSKHKITTRKKVKETKKKYPAVGFQKHSANTQSLPGSIIQKKMMISCIPTAKTVYHKY